MSDNPINPNQNKPKAKRKTKKTTDLPIVKNPKKKQKKVQLNETEMQKEFEEYGFMNEVIVPEELPIVPEELPVMVIENKQKRCPKGSRRDKTGNCVPIKEPEVKEIPLPPQPKKPETNMFLEEKERLERENPLKNHEFLYPDLNDPNFNIKIALKKEFSDAQYDGKIRDIEKQADLLCKAKFELSPHQVFVKNFLSVDTPYKGLLLYHGLGTGKTCSAIGVA